MESGDASNVNSDSKRIHKLDKGSELRFEVDAEPIQCQLIEGLAELFGTELRPEQKYTFQKGAKVAIFTFYGCKLRLIGKPEVEYVAMETPMTFYVNISNAFEGLRVNAEKENRFGPNILVAGPSDVGKTTLCRILLNYAVRNGRTPVFVDLDLDQSSITIPGNIGAVVIEKPADIEDSFQINAPLLFHFGHTSPKPNATLYDLTMSSLSELIERKKSVDPNVKHSGIIVNTCGWVQGNGYQSILQAINHFHIDVVLVIDQERLYSELIRDLKSKSHVKVIFTPKNGGVVTRSREFRVEMRDASTRNYFYGTASKPLYPYLFDIPFAQFNAYKVGSPNLPDSCLPLGMKPEDNSTKLTSVQPSSLLNNILAISCATTEDDIQKAITTNIYGFIAVTKVDTERQMVTVLSPQPRPLPKNSILLLSDVQFVDLE